MIDLVGEPRLEITQRIVGQRRKMQYRVKAGQIASFDVSRVLADGWNFVDLAAGRVGAARIEIAVQAHDLVARTDEHWRHYRANVTQMARQYDRHDSAFPNEWTLDPLVGAATAGAGDYDQPTAKKAAAGVRSHVKSWNW